MDTIADRPNVLFLIAIRNNELYYKLLVIIKLRRNTYKRKMLRTLTKITKLNGNFLDSGDEEYCIFDEFDAPVSYIYPNNITYSINNGGCIPEKKHRETLSEYGTIGPAIECSIVDSEEDDEEDAIKYVKKYIWMQNDKVHRDEGPAFIGIEHEEDSDDIYNYDGEELEEDDLDDFYDCCPCKCYNHDEPDPFIKNAIIFDKHNYVNVKWYKHGKLHRDPVNGQPKPAVYNRCFIEYYIDGKLHNDHGPAGIYIRQDEFRILTIYEHKIHGETSNKCGPAIIHVAGINEFWHNNHIHKPSFCNDELIHEYWIDGVKHRDEFDDDGESLPAVIEYEEWFGDIIREEWWFEGELHREDGAAVILYENGVAIKKEWYNGGMRHRLNEPAVFDIIHGIRVWWVNGSRHREDGPAVMYAEGSKLYYAGTNEWWLNGEKIES